MAQVVWTDGGAISTTAVTASATVAVPAALTGETQGVVLTVRGTVFPVLSGSGWVNQVISDVDSQPNKLYVITRNGPQDAATLTLTYTMGASQAALARGFSASGALLDVERNTATQSTGSSTCPPTPSVDQIDEGEAVCIIAPGTYPRRFSTGGASVPSGFTSIYDAYAYTSGGGMALGIARKDTTAGGTISPGTWSPLPLAGEGTDPYDFWRMATLMFSPTAAVSGDIDVTIDADAAYVAAPGVVNVTPLQGGALVNWTDLATDETSYEVLVAPIGQAYAAPLSVAAGGTSRTVTGLASSADYYIGVRAVRGSDYSAIIEKLFRTLPSTSLAPTNVVGVATGTTTAIVSWSPPAVTDYDSFEIWETLDSEEVTLLGTALLGATAAPISGLTAATTYTVSVRVVIDGVGQAFGNESTFATLAESAPGTPLEGVETTRVARNRRLMEHT